MSKSAMPPDEETFAQIMEFVRSSQGQQMLAQLKQIDPPLVQKAMAQAASGDMDQLKSSVRQLLHSQQTQALLQQLGGDRRE